MLSEVSSLTDPLDYAPYGGSGSGRLGVGFDYSVPGSVVADHEHEESDMGEFFAAEGEEGEGGEGGEGVGNDSSGHGGSSGEGYDEERSFFALEDKRRSDRHNPNPNPRLAKRVSEETERQTVRHTHTHTHTHTRDSKQEGHREPGASSSFSVASDISDGNRSLVTESDWKEWQLKQK
jgi:hypothetical protein